MGRHCLIRWPIVSSVSEMENKMNTFNFETKVICIKGGETIPPNALFLYAHVNGNIYCNPIIFYFQVPKETKEKEE